jgi:hypothetical protein
MTTKKLLKPKTVAEYAKVFNDILKLLGHSDVRVIEDDVLLLRQSIIVRVDLKKLGSMSLSLKRREFDKSVNKMLKLAVRAFKQTRYEDLSPPS